MPSSVEPLPALDSSVDRFNALIRGELSAVETYEQIIASFGLQAPAELNDCLRSHQVRVAKLTERVTGLGGTPVDGSGLWGSFAKLVEGSAALFGHKNALAALEEGEDHGLALYRERLDDHDLDVVSRQLLEAELMPEQLRTHDAVRELCRTCV